jgi:hypothetical protein
MSAVLLRHLDALAASVTLLEAQISALRHAVQSEQVKEVPRARLSLPPRCVTVEERRCALQNDEAMQQRGNFGDPNAWSCAGCGYVEGTPA